MIEGTPKSHIFDRRALRRVVAATSVTALVLAGCDKRPKITEGDVYKKVHNDLAGATLPAGKGQLVSYLSLEQDIEAVLSKPIHKEMGFKMEDLKKLGLSVWNSQYGEISVAQCPTPEPRTPETIGRDAKRQCLLCLKTYIKTSSWDSILDNRSSFVTFGLRGWQTSLFKPSLNM